MVRAAPEVEEGAPATSPEADALPDRSVRRPAGRGPALVVLGIAALIVVVGLVGAALTSTSGKVSTTSLRKVTLADGSSVSLTPATTALRSVTAQGQPPGDILGNLAVPSNSRPTGTVDEDLASGVYDRTADFATPLAGDEVVDTFKALLPKLGWHLIFVGEGERNGRSGMEVLAKRGSADGNEWEVGVVVAPTTSAGTTPFSVEVYEQSDGG